MPFVTLANQKIFYAEAGAGTPPMIFIHGAAGNHLVWGFQLRALAEHTRAISVDLPGHGRSDLPGCTTVADYADVIRGLLDELQIERAILVGHSMGGAIAQTFALAHPDRVAGLGLVGTGARLRVLPAILEGVLTDFDETAEFVVAHSYAPGIDETLRQRAIAEFKACPAQITHGDFLACNNFDIMSRVGEIRTSAVIVCGTLDQMTPLKYSQFLADQLHAHLVIVEKAGHSVMIEQPDAVNRALIDLYSLSSHGWR